MKFRPVLIAYIILLMGCLTTKKTNNRDQFKTVTHSYNLKGYNGVILKVEIEYAVTRNGYLNNGSIAQFIVTNVGSVPYLCSDYFHGIVFEFTASDGKVFEKSEQYCIDLKPGKSGESRTVSINAGLNRFCTSVQVVRLDK